MPLMCDGCGKKPAKHYGLFCDDCYVIIKVGFRNQINALEEVRVLRPERKPRLRIEGETD